MADHFAAIGLRICNERQYSRIVRRAVKVADVVPVSDGRYLHWAQDCGADLWLQIDNNDELLGIAPHFVGESRMRVGIVSRLSREIDNAMEGAFMGWADPSTDEPESGLYPFVFDCPDIRVHESIELPSIHTVQISAFAHEVMLFDSVEEYKTSIPKEQQMAPQAFIPSGMFSLEGDATDPPLAYGVIYGNIVKAEKRRNPYRWQVFYWALVESYGGSFDVVIEPDLLPKKPVVGGVLAGTFWLSGRLLDA